MIELTVKEQQCHLLLKILPPQKLKVYLWQTSSKRPCERFALLWVDLMFPPS